MKTALIAAAFAGVLVASPAMANEGRLEARGGIAWAYGASTETIGVAAGYDVDLGATTFIGIEGVADTDFDISDPVLGANARLGFKTGQGRLFVTGGYAYDTGFDFDDAVVGAGYQHNLGSKALLSVQYQRYLDTHLNRATVGVGVRF
jgi:hypothetical protein